MTRIAVIGSINMDIVNRVRKLPLPGETVHGLGTIYSPGGKGANQAVAAAYAGGEVLMVGAVGTDAFGDVLTSDLSGYGVSVDAVSRKQGTSGLAFIAVDDGGENNILLSSGANSMLSKEDLDREWPQVEECSAILLQNEIPWETTLWAMKRAYKSGIRVYFNPAPAIRIPKEVLPLVHCLILNETEAEVMTGMPLGSTEQEGTAVRTLLAKGAHCVVLTLGNRGAFYADRQGKSNRIEAFRIHPVDTTAAGDTFIGYFATAREQSQGIEASLRFGTAAAAISVTRAGAQQSIPKREETIVFLN